jgi:hypothetical protein
MLQCRDSTEGARTTIVCCFGRGGRWRIVLFCVLLKYSRHVLRDLLTWVSQNVRLPPPTSKSTAWLLLHKLQSREASFKFNCTCVACRNRPSESLCQISPRRVHSQGAPNNQYSSGACIRRKRWVGGFRWSERISLALCLLSLLKAPLLWPRWSKAGSLQ